MLHRNGWEIPSALQYEPVVTKIFAGSDHAGFALRGKVVEHLRARGFEVEDRGAASPEPSDYPDYAAVVGRAVRDQAGALGVLVCGTGIGVSIAANKVRGVRAAAAWSEESARLARAHNDVNVLCLGARELSEKQVLSITDAWLGTSFEGGRHQRRVDKVTAVEAEEAGRPHKKES
jgi:ribose 5-phosphate isomerase B